jgi:hypothetical protein
MGSCWVIHEVNSFSAGQWWLYPPASADTHRPGLRPRCRITPPFRLRRSLDEPLVLVVFVRFRPRRDKAMLISSKPAPAHTATSANQCRVRLGIDDAAGSSHGGERPPQPRHPVRQRRGGAQHPALAPNWYVEDPLDWAVPVRDSNLSGAPLTASGGSPAGIERPSCTTERRRADCSRRYLTTCPGRSGLGEGCCRFVARVGLPYSLTAMDDGVMDHTGARRVDEWCTRRRVGSGEVIVGVGSA